MFGGVGYILRGNMACGIVENDLVVRTGPDAYESALTRPHTRPFDIFGRSMDPGRDARFRKRRRFACLDLVGGGICWLSA